MWDHITIGNETVLVGDELISNKYSECNCICKPNTKVIVRAIQRDIQYRVGLVSTKKLPFWGDLDGLSKSKRGLWCSVEMLQANFFLIRKVYRVKGINESCKILFKVNSTKEPSYMVEFMNDIVNGNSGDGLGRKNRCSIVSVVNMIKLSEEFINLKD